MKHLLFFILFFRYLKSTINNIRLIAQFRKIVSDKSTEDAERKFFIFWVDFFAEAIKSDPEQTIRFPVCIIKRLKIIWD